jgi:hypothetical protein
VRNKRAIAVLHDCLKKFGDVPLSEAIDRPENTRQGPPKKWDAHELSKIFLSVEAIKARGVKPTEAWRQAAKFYGLTVKVIEHAWTEGHDRLTEDALSKQFGEAIAEIKEIEQAIEAAESTIEAGRDEIRQEVGITDPAKFNEMARPIEAKQSAPWLRKGAGGEIRVVDLEKRVERVATPEEIESGVYYKNFEDYSNRKDVA